MMTKSSNSVPSVSRVEQWAIISQQRAVQAQRMMQMKRLQQYNKKLQFKHDLDMQIKSKYSMGNIQQQNDRNYLQYILKKAQQQKQMQDNQKKERVQKRKQIQQDNLKALNSMMYSRSRSIQPEYNLQIGLRSQILQKQKQRKGKKQMLDTLDLQLKAKHNESFRMKFQQSSNQSNNPNPFAIASPNPARMKNYKQDQKVYQTYEKALRERQKQHQQFYKKITQQASKLKAKQIQEKTKAYRQNREAKTDQMMQTLQNQVKNQSQKRQQQRSSNPEESSFQFISNMFRQHPQSYNKQEYYKQLKRQAEEQKQRKKHEKFMSNQQYKLNMNQLNKIVSGQYAYDKYVDRSLDNIGATSLKQPVVNSYGANTEFIKNQLEKLKKKRNGFYSRMQNSFS